MKNKKVTTLLIIVVIAIWGIVFFRIFSSMSSEGIEVVKSSKKFDADIDNFENVKSFSLIAKYRDPFLGKTYTEPREGGSIVRKPKINTPVTPPAPVAEIDWSFIKYMGSIKNANNEKKISLISINNKEYMINEGETIEDVKCLKNYKDSVRVVYQGKIKCLKRLMPFR